MKVQDQLYGFTVMRSRRVEELDATLWELKHDKTGANLVWLDNAEENKLFAIAFKTLPSDDTGVFHILEHSVLCGSEKYPVKEPFLDLIKGSMNTFLNAFTSSDWTAYPVSSKNRKDFLNLTEVYLDAVFCPMIYRNPLIFRQEGWRYSLHEGEESPTYNGVVFNEMKGSFSSVDTQVMNHINRMLFPDSPYGFVSGGDPEKIPDLTYEHFLDMHREFYHPTNSRIYLDGQIPLEETLSLIDSYLSRYEKSDKQHEIISQKPVESLTREYPYAIGAEEDPKQRTQIAIGKILCDWSDRKKQTAVSILASYLMGSNDAPLKKAILEHGLAQDVSFDVMDGIAQPYTILQFQNTEKEALEPLKTTIKETISGLLEKGLDKDELSAVIDHLAFSMKSAEEPRGIYRIMRIVNSWIYDGDPLMYLTSDDLIAELREALKGNYFELLMEECFLDDAHKAELVMIPSRTKTAEDSAKEAERLKNETAEWSEEDRKATIEMNERLDAWQQTPDSEELKATLPKLELSDIDDEISWTETEVTKEKDVTKLIHSLQTDGIANAGLYFSICDIRMEDIPKLSLALSFLGDLPTASHSVRELQKEMKRSVGKRSITILPIRDPEGADKCRLYIAVTFSALEERFYDAVELIREILLETRFDDDELIKALLKQEVEGMYQSIIGRGNSFAMTRAGRYFSASGAISELANGFSEYRYISNLSNQYETESRKFITFAENMKSLFTERRLLLSETGSITHDLLSAFDLPKGDDTEMKRTLQTELEPAGVPEAILIPAPVSYAAACSSLNQFGKRYNGRFNILSSILSYGYLWSEIRVRGGAYGCGFFASEGGSLGFYSYRDPSPLRSVEVYRNTAQFLKEYVESDEPVDSYIISSVGQYEKLRTPRQKGIDADLAWMIGKSREDVVQIRKEMLNLKKEDLLEDCELFGDAFDRYAICVVCGEEQLSNQEGWKVERL